MVKRKPVCRVCGDVFSPRRVRAGYKTCLFCGEEEARLERKSWTVLTPHKQGPMFFTAESARSMAKGINNKGGLVK